MKQPRNVDLNDTDRILLCWCNVILYYNDVWKSQKVEYNRTQLNITTSTSQSFKRVPQRLQQDVRSATRWWGITITPSSRQTTRSHHYHQRRHRHLHLQNLCGTWSAPPLRLAATLTTRTTATTAVLQAIAPALRRQSHRWRPQCRTVTLRLCLTGRPATIITITRTTTLPIPPCSSRSTVLWSADGQGRSKNPNVSGYPPSRAFSSSPTFVSWPLS